MISKNCSVIRILAQTEFTFAYKLTKLCEIVFVFFSVDQYLNKSNNKCTGWCGIEHCCVATLFAFALLKLNTRCMIEQSGIVDE